MPQESYKIIDAQIDEMIRRTVVHTSKARAVVRKGGFRSGSETDTAAAGLGVLVLAIPPVVYVSGGTVSSPV